MLVRLIIRNTHYIEMRTNIKKKPIVQDSFESKRKQMKTIFLQMHKNFTRPTYPNTLPNKKWSEHHSYRASIKNIKTQQQNRDQKYKIATQRSASVPIDLECLQQIIANSANKKQQPEVISLEKMFSNKLKYKIKRNSQQHRQNTIHSDAGPALSPTVENQPEKKLNSIIFAQFIDFQEDQQREILKSQNVYLRTSEGKRQKIDGYMYLRKIKAKCLTRQRNLSISQSTHNPISSQRALYTKSDQKNQNKKFYLTSYIHISKKDKKIAKKEDHSEQKLQCRPWSSTKSDHNLD